MQDPVILCDGHSYERESIQQWLEHHVTSPQTNVKLKDFTLIPNTELRAKIQDLRQERTNASPVSENMSVLSAGTSYESDSVLSGVPEGSSISISSAIESQASFVSREFGVRTSSSAVD
eukprot:TRINITY_DN2835_c0_g1_i1.p1 TRINITY_DN2835_c0_g1~~TRINITY_DN2835_c0_g1_i1.p1  ORF type:complete len:119 (+),score=15.58 TRINITY_DN2835_c0_g1_i1:499-855(+)